MDLCQRAENIKDKFQQFDANAENKINEIFFQEIRSRQGDLSENAAAASKPVPEKDTDALREALAVAQHHDSITGTSTEAVSCHYRRLLHDGSVAADVTTCSLLWELLNNGGETPGTAEASANLARYDGIRFGAAKRRGDVLADFAVAARRALGKDSVAVVEDNRQSVNLRLDDEFSFLHAVV